MASSGLTKAVNLLLKEFDYIVEPTSTDSPSQMGVLIYTITHSVLRYAPYYMIPDSPQRSGLQHYSTPSISTTDWYILLQAGHHMKPGMADSRTSCILKTLGPMCLSNDLAHGDENMTIVTSLASSWVICNGPEHNLLHHYFQYHQNMSPCCIQ